MIFGVINKHKVEGVKFDSARDRELAFESLSRQLEEAMKTQERLEQMLRKARREKSQLQVVTRGLAKKAAENNSNEVAGGAVIPATKFVNAAPNKNMAKVQEEFTELFEAYMMYLNHPDDATFEHVLEEGADLQMSVETFVASLGATLKQRRESKDRVIAKNTSRGYYD